MSYVQKMIQSNPSVGNPLLITADSEKRAKARKFQIGGLVETSSNSSSGGPGSHVSNNTTPKGERFQKTVHDINSNTIRRDTAGLPTAVNPNTSAENSSGSNNKQSPEMDEDLQ